MMKYFNNRGSVYTSLHKRYSSFIIGLIFLCFSIMCVYLCFDNDKSKGQILALGCASLIPTLIYMGQLGRRIEIEINQNKLTISYFDFFSRNYDLTKFMNFEVINHKAYGIYLMEQI